MDRFEGTRDATLAKYRMMQRPKGKTSDAVDLAVDGVSILCLGEDGFVLGLIGRDNTVHTLAGAARLSVL